jgi:hypothetical protein
MIPGTASRRSTEPALGLGGEELAWTADAGYRRSSAAAGGRDADRPATR